MTSASVIRAALGGARPRRNDKATCVEPVHRWKSACRASPGLLLLLIASVAHGYDGSEHARLSDLALWFTLERSCGGSVELAACSAARNLLPTGDDVTEGKTRLSFGNLTAAADYFSYTKNMVPDPEGCAQTADEEYREVTCPETRELLDACSELNDDCYEAVLAFTKSQIHTRRLPSRFFARHFPKHLNRDHFREFAAQRYNELHRRAVRQAGQGQYELALHTEAIALHYLHDLFAPGHLASARADFSDPASGSVHDRFNRRGLKFRVAPDAELCEALNRLEFLLGRPDCESQPPPSLTPKKTITLDAEDAATLQGFVDCDGSSGGAPYRALGDGSLLDGDKFDIGKERRAHRTFLVLASALSIGQILAVPQEKDLLAICFQRQSGHIAQQSEWRRPPWMIKPSDKSLQGGTGSWEPVPHWSSVWPPAASLTRQGSTLPDDSGLCYPDLQGALAGYLTRWEELSEAEKKAFRKYTGTSVLEFVWSPVSWGVEGRADGRFRFGASASSRFELAWTFGATIPDTEIEQRVLRGCQERLTGELFEGLKRRGLQRTWGLAVHREERPDYDVWGVGLLNSYHRKLGSSDLDAYIITEPGFGYYKNAVQSTTHWRLSARTGVGISFIFLELGMEYGYVLDSAGSGYRESRYFAGSRVRVSTSWPGKLLTMMRRSDQPLTPNP